MSHKILLVEDDPFLIKVFAAHLKKEGFETVEVRDGAAALQATIHEKPFAVLLDVALPHKNGFTILTELKANAKTKNVPVFMVTKLGADTDREHAKTLGADGYFNKMNVRFDDIIAALRTIASKK